MRWFEDALAILLGQDVRGEEAKRPDALPGEPGIAAQIVPGLLGTVVRRAVDLNRKADREAVETSTYGLI